MRVNPLLLLLAACEGGPERLFEPEPPDAVAEWYPEEVCALVARCGTGEWDFESVEECLDALTRQALPEYGWPGDCTSPAAMGLCRYELSRLADDPGLSPDTCPDHQLAWPGSCRVVYWSSPCDTSWF